MLTRLSKGKKLDVNDFYKLQSGNSLEKANNMAVFMGPRQLQTVIHQQIWHVRNKSQNSLMDRS